MAGLQAELSFLSGPYRLAAFAKSSRGDPCSRDPLSSLAGLCSKLCSAGSWSPVVILPCCLSRGPQGICVGHGRGKIVTSPAGVHTIPGWPDDPSLHRVRVPSTHLGLQVRKKNGPAVSAWPLAESSSWPPSPEPAAGKRGSRRIGSCLV